MVLEVLGRSSTWHYPVTQIVAKFQYIFFTLERSTYLWSCQFSGCRWEHWEALTLSKFDLIGYSESDSLSPTEISASVMFQHSWLFTCNIVNNSDVLGRKNVYGHGILCTPYVLTASQTHQLSPSISYYTTSKFAHIFHLGNWSYWTTLGYCFASKTWY